MAFPSRGFDWCYRINCLRNYLRKLERRPKWQHIRFTYDILSFLWSVQPLRVTPAYTGEKHCAICNFAMAVGSPPRIRGKVNGLAAGMAQGGDHPRACGEKVTPSRMLVGMSGSPPRMRGKGHALADVGGDERITPAHAGKRERHRAQGALYEDHPRACGEKGIAATSTWAKQGSPPRMRGKGNHGFRWYWSGGITPAHAGKRACFWHG